MTSEIRLLKPDRILAELPEEVIASLPLYNQPFFSELIKPGKLRYATLESTSFKTHYFPLSTDRLIWKRRVFILPFCQRFTPFTPEESGADVHALPVWISWLKDNTSTCQWAFESATVPDGCITKTNQFIRLEQNAETLLGKWKKGRRSALLKSEDLRTQILSETEFRSALKSMNNTGTGIGWSPNTFEQAAILRISESPESCAAVERYGVFEGRNCLSLVLLFKWQNRIHYLFSQSSERGFEKDSLTRFFHSLIEWKAESRYFFDFEGSSIPGVNAFFRSLGAEEESYFEFRKGF
jgi:hypothetical protein